MGRRTRDRRSFQNRCRGKLGHDTHGQAMGALRVFKLHLGQRGAGLQAYRCLDCRKWHLGNVRPPLFAAVKRVVARTGEAVDIVWRRPDGMEMTQRCLAPPAKVWDARMEREPTDGDE